MAICRLMGLILRPQLPPLDVISHNFNTSTARVDVPFVVANVRFECASSGKYKRPSTSKTLKMEGSVKRAFEEI